MKRAWLIYGGLFVILAALLAKKIMTKKEWALKLKSTLAEMSAAGELASMKPEALASLSAHETGWGTGRIFGISNNLFSITQGSSWNGPTVLSGALDPSGAPYKFRFYPTWRDSILDFVKIMNYTRYAPARKAAASGDVAGFASALALAGYGDPNEKAYAALIVKNFNELKAMA